MLDSTRAVKNESGVVVVDDEEDIAICVKEIIACIRYVEISVRSSVCWWRYRWQQEGKQANW